jgi:RNA polymerase sigma-70 factor, ECF subfamily
VSSAFSAFNHRHAARTGSFEKQPAGGHGLLARRSARRNPRPPSRVYLPDDRYAEHRTGRRRVHDQQLITRILAGDPAAERALYDAHVDRVYRLAYRLAEGDGDLAQDFTQEAFVRAFDRLGDFRGDAALSTWLHAITVSVALNGMRKVKRWRERETTLDGVPEVGVETRTAEPDLKTRLRQAIHRLPEKYRVVFLMYDVEGYTHEEIGAVLAMPSGTSKARLSRARAKLREELAEFAGEWAL